MDSWDSQKGAALGQGWLGGAGHWWLMEHFVILSLRFQDPKGSPVPKAIILQLFCFSCVLDGQELESEPRAGRNSRVSYD